MWHRAAAGQGPSALLMDGAFLNPDSSTVQGVSALLSDGRVECHGSQHSPPSLLLAATADGPNVITVKDGRL